MPIVDYFVSPANGSDVSGDGSLANPWKTRQHAVNTLTWNPNGGVQLNIQAGAADVMTESFTVPFTPVFEAPFITRGYTAAANDGGIGSFDGDGQYAVHDVSLTYASYCVYRDLKLGNCSPSWLVLYLGLQCSIYNCEIYGAGSGVQCGAGGVVDGNYFHDCTTFLLRCDTAVDNLLDARNGNPAYALLANVIADGNRILVGGSTLGIYAGTIPVRNNAIYSAGGDGTGISGLTGSSFSEVVNNIIEGFSGVGGIGIADSSNHTIALLSANRVYNCATAYSLPNTPYFDDGNNLTLTASPFTDPANGDLSLNNDPHGGALCRAASYPRGFQGGPRTQWADCGAIQHADPTPPATPTLTITDNGDGTGATATISGSSAGSVNTIQTAPFPTAGAAANWSDAATRVGDGSASVSLSPGFYLVRCRSALAGFTATGNEFAWQILGAVPIDPSYGGIIATLRTVLMGDSTLTDPNTGLLASYGLTLNGIAQSPSRTNSIFGADPPGDRNFPCVTLWENSFRPAVPRQHDHPMAGVELDLQVSVWGKRQDLRPIITEIDSLIEGAWYGGAMDTNDWKFADVDTSGTWQVIRVPDSYAMDSGQPVVQMAKVFTVNASNKTLGIV